jgi:prolipoprotein diacylglyceryltransferase
MLHFHTFFKKYPLFFIFGLKPSRVNVAAPSLAIFSCIARIGCIYTGCCSGLYGIPTAWLELAFGAAAFVWLHFFTKKDALFKYIAAYSIFRLATEFFRAEPAPYYAVQILAGIVLAVAAAVWIVRAKKKRHTKSDFPPVS